MLQFKSETAVPRSPSEPIRIAPSSRRQRPRIRRYVYNRPALYPKQLEAIFDAKDFEGGDARFSWIEASTKAGKTVGCIAWLYEQALLGGGAGKNYWWVSPKYGTSKIAFTRLKQFLPKDQFESNKQEQTVTLPNGAVIWFKSSDNPDGLYGEDVYAAVIDEGSRCKEETWPAVRSTLTATRGPCRIIGNVKGRRNWFYQMAHAAKAGRKNHAYYKITAADAVAAGVLAKDEIDDAEASLASATFRELYYAEAADDAGNPFTLAAIKACLKPLSILPPVQWGWDLAKRKDWTVGVAVDQNGDICRFVRFQLDWENTTNQIVKLIGMLPALIDSTGVGDPIVERIQKKCPNVMGYHFTAPSKQRLIEGLVVAVQRHETSVLKGANDNDVSVHQEEMESFEYEYTKTGVKYCVPEGMGHDDTVMAHALAIMGKSKGPDLSTWAALVRTPKKKAA